MTRLRLTILCCVALAPQTCLAAKRAEPLRLTLPAEFYAVVGVETSVYFDNLVLTQTPEDYQFEVACDVGRRQPRRWSVSPKPADAGDHAFTVTVKSRGGDTLAQARTTLRVVAANAGQGRRATMLIVGDSLTHATLYPNEIARLLSEPGNPTWRMLGTHRPKQAAAGVAHEGYGGWTWQRFVSHYEPNPDGTYRKRSSPFVFLNAEGKPQLDLDRYFRESCSGERPDFVVFLLGINDCFSADPADPKAIDERIDAVFKQADTLLAAFHKAAPQAELAVCGVTPPNAREEAFQANYKGRYHRWGWKRIQHRLVQRQIEHFAAREKENVYFVPSELNLDPIDGYPANNAVHPNAAGYKQVAASVYAWLKSRLAAEGPNTGK